MTKGKGTKGSTTSKSRQAGSKPKAKTSGSRPNKDAKKTAPAAKRSASGATSKTKGGAKASASKPQSHGKKVEKPASTPAAASVRPKAAEPAAAAAPATSNAPGAAEGFLIRKKKVKRGAPPMLHNRRLMRRPAPAAGEGPATPKPPTPPGSLHAPARAPEGAERLKANLTEAINGLARLRALKRNLNRQFWEAALLLKKLSSPELYQAKGYGSWESFLEREVERELSIGRTVASDLVRIVDVFNQKAAEDIGLERLRAALRAIWPEPGGNGSTPPPGGALS